MSAEVKIWETEMVALLGCGEPEQQALLDHLLIVGYEPFAVTDGDSDRGYTYHLRRLVNAPVEPSPEQSDRSEP